MWSLLFSEVTLFEYNVSTISSPIVELYAKFPLQKKPKQRLQYLPFPRFRLSFLFFDPTMFINFLRTKRQPKIQLIPVNEWHKYFKWKLNVSLPPRHQATTTNFQIYNLIPGEANDSLLTWWGELEAEGVEVVAEVVELLLAGVGVVQQLVSLPPLNFSPVLKLKRQKSQITKNKQFYQATKQSAKYLFGLLRRLSSQNLPAVVLKTLCVPQLAAAFLQ